MEKAIEIRLRSIYDRVQEVKENLELRDLANVEYEPEDGLTVTIGNTLRDIENDLANILIND